MYDGTCICKVNILNDHGCVPAVAGRGAVFAWVGVAGWIAGDTTAGLFACTGGLPKSLRVGAITSDTILMSLMRMFMEGPEVSLNGSPTVSPVTDALWGSDFL